MEHILFTYEEYRGIADLTIIIPMLQKTDFPFLLNIDIQV